jgi:hypothetical protein
MVDRFDSYIVRARRALPAPAQALLDSISAVLPSLKQSLERVETLGKEVEKSKGYIARAEGVSQGKLAPPAASPLAPLEAK